MLFVHWIIWSSLWWSVSSSRRTSHRSNRGPTRPLGFIAHRDHEFIGEDPVIVAELKRRMSNLNSNEMPTRRMTPMADIEKFPKIFKDNTDGEFGFGSPVNSSLKGRRFISKISNAWTDTMNSIKNSYTNTVKNSKAGIKAAKKDLQKTVTDIKKGAQVAYDRVRHGAKGAIEGLKQSTKLAMDKAKAAAKTVGNKYKDMGNKLKDVAKRASNAANDFADKAAQAGRDGMIHMKRQYLAYMKRARKFARKVTQKSADAHVSAKKAEDNVLEWFRTLIPQYHPYWDLLNMERKNKANSNAPPDQWAPGKGDDANIDEFELDWDEDEIYSMQLKTAEQCIYGIQKRIEELEPIILLHKDDPLVRMAHITTRLDKWLAEMSDFYNYTHSRFSKNDPWVTFEWVLPYNGDNPYYFANLRHIMYYQVILKRYIDIQYAVDLLRKLQASASETYKKNEERLSGFNAILGAPPRVPLLGGTG